jgi:SNF2 family DNA or RNA helicase
MKILDSFIVDENGSHVAAKEFWMWQKSNNDSLGLRLLGLAKPKIRVVLLDNKPSFELCLVTDIGTITPTIESLEKDYIVYQNYWIPFDLNYMQPLVETLNEMSILPGSQISIGKLLKLLSILRGYQIPIDDEAQLSTYSVDTTKIERVNLALPLYDYQEKGIAWLIELSNQEIGGLLCDEMGLGKTAQAFGLISHFVGNHRNKILVVTPASLIYNWSREINKFVPGLAHYLHVGPDRSFHPSELESKNVVIVSYDLLTRDLANFSKITWDLVICDEAQALKNSDSKRHNAIRQLDCLRKFLITGTPIENSLSDLWSLMDIVRPGLLGTLRSFQSLLEDHPVDARRLSDFAAPLMLRRVVKDVAKDLPKLITKEISLLGTTLFNDFYEEKRQEFIYSKQNPLSAITELTQICCYPGLKDESYVDRHDAKLNETLEILTNVKLSEEKAIIFTTFTASLDLIRSVVTRQLSPAYISTIDGRVSSSKRDAIIANFQEVEGFAVLCIQPAAGGVGLNITGANHVIHFNRQWNPAVERQATARAYRRGQKLTVFEYLLGYVGTIEEYISDTLSRKSELAKYATEAAASEGSNKDIQKALSISPLMNQISPEGWIAT